MECVVIMPWLLDPQDRAPVQTEQEAGLASGLILTGMGKSHPNGVWSRTTQPVKRLYTDYAILASRIC
jgi:hypothetical protein